MTILTKGSSTHKKEENMLLVKDNVIYLVSNQR